MNYRFLKLSIVGVLTSLFLWSCEGYLNQFSTERLSTNVALTPGFAAPIAYGEFSIQDLLEMLNDSSGLISQDEDSLINIYFSDTLLSVGAGDLLTIPDQLGSETYIQSDIEIPEWLDIPEGTEYTFAKKETLDFLLDPEDDIDSLKLKAGTLYMNSYSQFKHPGWLRITSGNIVSPDGDSLDISSQISSPSGDYTDMQEMDLNGYTILMDDGSTGGTGQAIIYVSLTLEKTAAPIGTTEKAGMNLDFRDIQYSAVFGKIGEREITDLSDELALGLFETVNNLPELYFENPEFTLIVHNSYGIPISLDIQKFQTRSAASGDLTDLEFKTEEVNPFNIAAQTIDKIGEFVTSSRTYNNVTTNISELLEKVPDRIDYSISASAGSPDGSTQQNFLLDTSKIVTEIELNLPMWLRTTGYTMQQELDIAIDSLLDEISFVDSAAMRLTTTSDWPFGISLQVYFQDDEGTTVSTLFDDAEAILAPAPVNSSTGLVDRSAIQENPFNVVLTPDHIDELQGATKAVIEATLITSDADKGTNVKFLSSYVLKYSLGVAAKFDFNSDNL